MSDEQTDKRLLGVMRKNVLQSKVDAVMIGYSDHNAYLSLLKCMATMFDQAAKKAEREANFNQEMFYIGKRDATNEAMLHYLELTREET